MQNVGALGCAKMPCPTDTPIEFPNRYPKTISQQALSYLVYSEFQNIRNQGSGKAKLSFVCNALRGESGDYNNNRVTTLLGSPECVCTKANHDVALTVP